MSTSPSSLFKKSLLAVAIVTMTGCASTAPDRIGGTLARAGSATADAGARAWHRTGYLLGLHDNAGPRDQADEEFTVATAPTLDEVDLAMLEADAILPGSGPLVAESDSVDLAAARIEQAIGQPRTQIIDTASGGSNSAELALFGPADESDVVRLEDAPEPTMIDSLEVVALEDYTHKVGETETLWDIAKLTTGDATNWHVLADINNLAPNAAVFPGQSLIIPADMLRPELANEPALEEETIIAAADTRLAIPEDSTLEAPTEVAEEPIMVVAEAASPVSSPIVNSSDDATGFDIEAGETLWDFAKRTTGDATYWQAIAAHNGFTEAQAVAVRQGQEIFVPIALLRPELVEIGTVVAKAAPKIAPTEETLVDTGDVEALDAGATVLAGATAPDTGAAVLDETQDITIVEAAYREGTEIDTGAGADPSVGEIMISGTYYPKAVYNDADFSSSLLMRVSPGTTLTVSKVDGAWYKVETEQGVGYVHNRDIK